MARVAAHWWAQFIEPAGKRSEFAASLAAKIDLCGLPFSIETGIAVFPPILRAAAADVGVNLQRLPHFPWETLMRLERSRQVWVRMGKKDAHPEMIIYPVR